MDGRMDGWTDKHPDSRMNGQKNRWSNSKTDRQMSGYMEGKGLHSSVQNCSQEKFQEKKKDCWLVLKNSSFFLPSKAHFFEDAIRKSGF